MQLFLDRDTGQFVTDSLFKAPVESVSFKRGDAAELELLFVKGNTITGLASGATVAFGIKNSNDYDGDFLAYAQTDEFTSVSNSYFLSPSFNTEALNAALGMDGIEGNDIASLTAMVEVSWSEASGVWQSSRTITATIHNDLIKGSEGTPVELDGPEEWLLENVIGSGTPSNPFTIAGTESPDIDGVLYPAGGAFSYSSDGAEEAPPSGTWVGVTWDVSESLHRIQVYEAGMEATGTWFGGGSDPDAPEAGLYTASSPTVGDATVTLGTLAAATHAFMSNGSALFANLGSAAMPLWHVLNSEPV